MQTADYREVPLLRRDGSVRAVALVDAADHEHLVGFRWFQNSNGYAVRLEHQPGGNPRAVLMHRDLMGLEYGDRSETDHINRNRLDNRRANLRVVTRGQQLQNVSSHVGSTSRFRGVYWADRTATGRVSKWRAQAGLNGTMTRLGTFESEVDAAIAVETWRRENMPFAEPDPELVRIASALHDLAA
jgi:hypothetical protein